MDNPNGRKQNQEAPILILVGDDPCEGLMERFWSGLGKALTSLGEKVIYSDNRGGDFPGLEAALEMQWKGIIGFQAPALFHPLFRQMPCKKYQFQFDNPIFYPPDFFVGADENYYLLCQDAGYAGFLKRYCGVKNALQLPPGGTGTGEPFSEDRDMDVIFLGTYFTLPERTLRPMEQEFYDYMILHPNLSFEEGLFNLCAQPGAVPVSEEYYLQLLYALADTCKRVTYDFRKRVIRTLLEGGISLHVFGESWKEFPVPEGASGKLILHGHLRAEDAPDLYRRAKVSLNVMTWHKAGMTERVADSMLGGAVCVSDRTDYLEEHFTEEEICLYDLAHLEKLPGMIRTLLGRADDREIIRKKAEVKARKEHTWDARAKQLQRLWNSDTKPGSMGIE